MKEDMIRRIEILENQMKIKTELTGELLKKTGYIPSILVMTEVKGRIEALEAIIKTINHQSGFECDNLKERIDALETYNSHTFDVRLDEQGEDIRRLNAWKQLHIDADDERFTDIERVAKNHRIASNINVNDLKAKVLDLEAVSGEVPNWCLDNCKVLKELIEMEICHYSDMIDDLKRLDSTHFQIHDLECRRNDWNGLLTKLTGARRNECSKCKVLEKEIEEIENARAITVDVPDSWVIKSCDGCIHDVKPKQYNNQCRICDDYDKYEPSKEKSIDTIIHDIRNEHELGDPDAQGNYGNKRDLENQSLSVPNCKYWNKSWAACELTPDPMVKVLYIDKKVIAEKLNEALGVAPGYAPMIEIVENIESIIKWLSTEADDAD